MFYPDFFVKIGFMYIRKTKTSNSSTGEAYFTHRLVRGERIAGKVRQITVLNLGRNLAIKQDDWPLLCSRIEQILEPKQITLVVIECPVQIERAAQYYAGKLIASAPKLPEIDKSEQADKSVLASPDSSINSSIVNEVSSVKQTSTDFQEVDVNSLELTQPRSVGVEHVGLHAIKQLGLIEELTKLGINGTMRAGILGNLIGRMGHPDSEIATWDWLQKHSALGELIDVDFAAMSHMTLYRASDTLMQHHKEIEDFVFGSVKSLFNFEETVTLYDLTNTYFEGDADGNPDANVGRSKEKRTDCPLVTLGMVLDGSGFVRRSRTFKGNVSEGTTLPEMLAGLDAPPGAMVIMDAGIAIEANISWLIEHGYRYLVVRRAGARQFDESRAIEIETASNAAIRLQKELSVDGKEVLLHCHSEGREAKEIAMSALFCQRYEAGLQKIVDGINKPRPERCHDKLQERIEQLKQKSLGADQHFKLNIATDESGKMVTGFTWEKIPAESAIASNSGECLAEDGKVVLSPAKVRKAIAKSTKLCERYEAGLQKIADAINKAYPENQHDKLLMRIGKLKQKSMGSAQHFKLNLTTDESGKIATGLTWVKAPVEGTMATHPGVYCLRSNELEWDEEKLWRTYTMLTDIESVFRSLKSELGLRPVYHSNKDRVDGHLFITVLAYQLVQVLRVQLKQAGIDDSWKKLRDTLSIQRRNTTSMRRSDGRSIHIRKSTSAEPDLMEIYKALNLNSAPGGTVKLIS